MSESITLNPSHQESTASVIWLHGLGADGRDFEPIVPELALLEERGVRFIFPNAPFRPVTANGGMRMRAWYDFLDWGFSGQEDEQGLQGSEQRLLAFIQNEEAQGIPRERIFLAGFSQGGAVALYTGLRAAQPLGGLVILSAYLPMANSFVAPFNREGMKTPLFMAHGRLDSIIPWPLAESARERLRVLGCAVEWRSYAMPHAVCPEEIRDISRFLHQALDASDAQKPIIA